MWSLFERDLFVAVLAVLIFNKLLQFVFILFDLLVVGWFGVLFECLLRFRWCLVDVAGVVYVVMSELFTCEYFGFLLILL